MVTSKPISTVSYNTESFLKEKLDMLLQQHIICCYQYIPHIGEDGDKNHIHLRVEPNKRLDTMNLTELLKEYEKGCDKPLLVRPWRPSKEEDWYLYAVHNPDYMRLKYSADAREKIPYKMDDIRVSADYDLECAFTRALASLEHTSASMLKQLRNGGSALDMAMQGENVFALKNCLALLGKTDYQRLQQDYADLLLSFNRLREAIENAEMDVVEDAEHNTWILVPLNRDFKDAPLDGTPFDN